MRTRTTLALATLAMVLLLAGCGGGPKLVPVTGAVTFNGKPLTAGSIWFHPAEGNPSQGEKPSCQLAIDGSFTMRTYPFGNGVPPGDYQVTLAPELASRIGRPQYADPAKTPWSVTVPLQGLTDHRFEVR